MADTNGADDLDNTRPLGCLVAAGALFGLIALVSSLVVVATGANEPKPPVSPPPVWTPPQPPPLPPPPPPIVPPMPRLPGGGAP